MSATYTIGWLGVLLIGVNVALAAWRHRMRIGTDLRTGGYVVWIGSAFLSAVSFVVAQWWLAAVLGAATFVLNVASAMKAKHPSERK